MNIAFNETPVHATTFQLDLCKEVVRPASRTMRFPSGWTSYKQGAQAACMAPSPVRNSGLGATTKSVPINIKKADGDADLLTQAMCRAFREDVASPSLEEDAKGEHEKKLPARKPLQQ